MNFHAMVFHEYSLHEVSAKAKLKLTSMAFWMTSTDTVQACRGLDMQLIPAHLVNFNKYG